MGAIRFVRVIRGARPAQHRARAAAHAPHQPASPARADDAITRRLGQPRAGRRLDGYRRGCPGQALEAAVGSAGHAGPQHPPALPSPGDDPVAVYLRVQPVRGPATPGLA